MKADVVKLVRKAFGWPSKVRLAWGIGGLGGVGLVGLGFLKFGLDKSWVEIIPLFFLFVVFLAFLLFYKNLREFLLATLVLSFVFNPALHFEVKDSYVYGRLVDYLVPAVYLSDLVFGVVLGYEGVLWLRKRGLGGIGSIGKGSYRVIFLLAVLFLLWSGGLIFVNSSSIPSIYKFFRIGSFFIFVFYFVTSVRSLLRISVKVIPIAGCIQFLIGVGQFFTQRSIGAWFLGEQSFNSSTPEAAFFSFWGEVLVRPYGTFPHPNVLGGFFAMSCLLALWWFVHLQKKRRQQLIWGLMLLCNLGGLVLSLSRGAWVGFGVGVVVLGSEWYRRFRRNRKWLVGSVVAVGTVVILAFPLVGSRFFSEGKLNDAFTRRGRLNEVAIEMIKDHPIAGVGLNNFIPNIREHGRIEDRGVEFLQPVHNVFLLVAAEEGRVGGVMFAAWLIAVLVFAFRQLLMADGERPMDHGRWLMDDGPWTMGNRLWSISHSLLAIFVAFLVISLFDHYFWTLVQGMGMFALVIGCLLGTGIAKGREV